MTCKIYTYKSKAAAVLLALCLGAIGAHRFYLGDAGLGVAYIVATLVLMVAFPPALMGITVLLCLEAVYFLCQGKGYYKRELMVEVGDA